MKDVTDILIELLSTLINQGFELPIYIFVVSQNCCVVAARYEGYPLKEKPTVHIFVEHIEGDDWELPINCFFVDGKGKSESVVKIDPEVSLMLLNHSIKQVLPTSFVSSCI